MAAKGETRSDEARAAALLHHRRDDLAKGDPVPLPLTMAAMYWLPGDPAGHRGYGRAENPVWEALEAAHGLLEEAECVVFPSGMGAISAALFACLGAGDGLLIPSDGYYTTRLLADRFLAKLGVRVETRPTARFAEGGFAGFKVVFAETPSNPGLDVCDLKAIATEVHAAGGCLIVDNTTMTPFGQRPLDLGADLLAVSDTKAPSGHSDILLGHVATRNAEIAATVREWRKLSGGIPGPFECWLGHRGLETLEMRFARMCDNAEALAPKLASHKAVKALRFPGLPGDPAHNLAAAQQSRFGFLMSLTLESEEKAEKFIASCPLLTAATSFGGAHSSAERRARWGDAVAPGFVRLSVGCEPISELEPALLAALDAVA